MHTRFTSDQFVCVDESAANRKLLNRNVGISKRGRRAKSKMFFHRGKGHSVLGPFTMDEGFLDLSCVEGGYDADRFHMALHQVVVRRLDLP